ncbi:GH25 family lysozyme [Streptomyces sp. NPDC049837]|uniref:GH25 family lysozyme n=1 Tax=Streptomyces sp. NPDC049837 TaxID=3155277 RepID=UPI003430CF23
MSTSRVRGRLARATAALAAAVGALGVLPAPAQAAAPSAFPVVGVDTSHYNHGKAEQTPIDWPLVAKTNSFAFMKATQGTTYQDKWFQRDFAAASKTSLLRAPYHFFDPKSTTDGLAQARHFVTTARAAGYQGNRAGELPPVLDVEMVQRNGKEVCPPELRADQLKVFLDELRKSFGVTPIVYTRASFVNECMGGKGGVFAGYPLWLARYESGATEPQPVPGAGAWTFWQHTEKGTTPGIPGVGDRNVFRGSLADLRAMTTGTWKPPQYDQWPVLRAGNSGVDVTTLQLLLSAKGHTTEADGAYGPATETQVKAFQRSAGLEADGIVGAHTWDALVPTLTTGAGGKAVEALQHQLTAAGHAAEVDGAFGAGTEAAVKAFQKSAGLTADGVAGPLTWRALLARA